MTDTMKAIVLGRFGGPDAFELRDVPVSTVGPRQVRVRVHATAVNPLDFQIRRGDYADYVPLPAKNGNQPLAFARLLAAATSEIISHVASRPDQHRSRVRDRQ